MATVDPKRAALVRALMERDLYEMLDVPRDAGDEEILAAIARRTEWVEETPMRHADREAGVAGVVEQHEADLLGAPALLGELLLLLFPQLPPSSSLLGNL